MSRQIFVAAVAGGLAVWLGWRYRNQKKEPKVVGEVSHLWHYPVKSMRGVDSEHLCFDALGVKDDRRWCVVDAKTRNFLTQRQLPRMALIAAVAQGPGSVQLTVPGEGAQHPSGSLTHTATVADASKAAAVTITIWKEECGALDAGDAVAGWLSAFLGQEVRLVLADPEKQRRVPTEYFPHGVEGAATHYDFADGFPVLLTTDASLRDLNARLGPEAGVPMRRFRPNIVVATGESPWSEDTWKVVRIGGLVFDCVKACGRCTLTTVDPDTGVRGTEPLATLKTFRLREGSSSPLFGINLNHRVTQGTINVGDKVTVLEWWPKLIPV